MSERMWPSLDAFYRADQRRHVSQERDFGMMWRQRASGGRLVWWPRFRVSVIRDTGEVYAIAQTNAVDRAVELLGTVGATGDEAFARAEAMLEGWAYLPAEESTLEWVRERVHG